MTERARKRRAKRKKVLKAHSKSEIKRLFAMGIEADVHPDWCAIESLGMCTCGAATSEEDPDECKALPIGAIMVNPPASEASGRHSEACPMPLSGDCTCKASGRCDDPLWQHPCCVREEHYASGRSEVWARQHIEALKLLEQACHRITAARLLLGDKKA